MPFVYVSTVLPGYLKHLEVANVWIGLAPALHNGVIALIQPFSAFAIPPGVRRLRRMAILYLCGGLAYAALGGFVLAGIPGAMLGLVVTLLAELLFSAAVGAGDPHYMQLVVHATTPASRGRFFGLRAVFLGLGGILGGEAAARVLRAGTAPANFGWCFLVGGLAYLVSVSAILFYRETSHAETPPARGNFREFVSERMLGYARQEDFRAYLIAVVLFSVAACGFPFLSLLLQERLGASDHLFGTLGALFMGCNLVMSWLLGAVCDRWGSRRGFALTLCLYALGVLGCLTLHDRYLLYAAYLLASVWMPGQLVAVTDLALRLASRSAPSDVTATMMVAMAPARIIGPVLVGAAIDQWSYGPALGGCVVAAGAALVALWWGRPRPAASLPDL
jgi:MFS family permease